MRSFCIKTIPSLVLPFCTFSRGYSRNSRSHYFITNSILLLIRVDTLHFMRAQKVIHKHSQKETKMIGSPVLSTAEHPWGKGVWRGSSRSFPQMSWQWRLLSSCLTLQAIDPHPLAPRSIIFFRFFIRRAIEPSEEIRNILRLHGTLHHSPEGPTEGIPYTTHST